MRSGEEALLPLSVPINVAFRCTLEVSPPLIKAPLGVLEVSPALLVHAGGEPCCRPMGCLDFVVDFEERMLTILVLGRGGEPS